MSAGIVLHAMLVKIVKRIKDNAVKIYRFNDKVALSFPGQPTVYIEVADAIELTRVLGRFTTDIRMKSFQTSTLSAITIGEGSQLFDGGK